MCTTQSRGPVWCITAAQTGRRDTRAMNTLQNKVAIITGGASGIGEAAVRRFVAEGAHVVIADLQQRKGEALATSQGDGCAFLKTDVTVENDVRGLVKFALDRFGRLDCFYSNAGFGRANLSITETPLEDFESQIAVLLRGTFLSIKHAGAAMKRQGSGAIINTSSVAAIAGGYSNHVYSAAKAGVISLTRTSALELGEAGVRVNCICPGSIPTPIFVRGIPLSESEVDQAVKTVAGFMGHNPLGRAGLPEEIANVAVWLASEGSSYVTGQAIVVDGGLTSGVLWQDQQAWAKALYGNLAEQFPSAFAELVRS
jgi:NAD(P)-dependent dehydrogenase (short-subunit alcohol dehydrogenase family)